MKLIVSEQLHASREMLFEHAQRKAKARVLIGCDVIESFLKRESVEGLRAIRKEPIENIGNALQSRWSLQIAVVFYRAENGDRGAGGVGFYNQSNTVGQGRV